MLVFLDESGRLETEDGIKRPTISAILIPESSLNEATREILRLKRSLCPPYVDPNNYELKSSKILRASAGGWKNELAENFFTRYLHTVKGLKVFAVVCRRPSQLLPNKIEVLPLHHYWLLSKVFLYMESCVPTEEFVTFIYDTQDTERDEQLSKVFTNFLYKHHEGQLFLKRITPFPLFGNSSLICGIELADMIAGCLSRQADLYDNCDKKSTYLLKRLTRYKGEIEKVKAEMFCQQEKQEYSIQYVKEAAMEKVLDHAKQKEVDIEIEPKNIEKN